MSESLLKISHTFLLIHVTRCKKNRGSPGQFSQKPFPACLLDLLKDRSVKFRAAWIAKTSPGPNFFGSGGTGILRRAHEFEQNLTISLSYSMCSYSRVDALPHSSELRTTTCTAQCTMHVTQISSLGVQNYFVGNLNTPLRCQLLLIPVCQQNAQNFVSRAAKIFSPSSCYAIREHLSH